MNQQEMMDRIYNLTVLSLKNGTLLDLRLSLAEEIGELATEFKIRNKAFANNHKTGGKDGVLGEAIDVYICLMSISNAFNYIYHNERVACNHLPDELVWYQSSDECIEYICNLNTGSWVSINNAFYKICSIIKNENCSLEEFYEIVDKKLTKWEKCCEIQN